MEYPWNGVWYPGIEVTVPKAVVKAYRHSKEVWDPEFMEHWNKIVRQARGRQIVIQLEGSPRSFIGMWDVPAETAPPEQMALF
jgi:2,4-dienoyl-CoA reductase-like NADH-dependent reductase (Old Yellow Enzyme family)